MNVRALVVYYSETGNTEKVAKAIANALNAELRRVEEAVDVLGYDLLFIGTPVHYFGPAKPVIRFLDGLPDLTGKAGVAFCTFHNSGDKKTISYIRGRLEERGARFLGGFSCKGESRLVANLGPRIFNKGRPNEEDLRKAEEFAKTIA
ncbi:MAG: flavodoxin domain-containing protein [Candidatus Freyarchaeota archaeon]|nr:flavodoxin domain-containing protein [Candidatus Jordarchaeia archaeon]